MTNIDRQALVEATAGFHNQRDSDPWSDLDDCIYAAIEAYEAARPEPNPWRPIEEAKRQGDWILVHKDVRMSGSFDLMFWDDRFEWCVAGGDQTYTNSDLGGCGAMFRTIDPPPQNEAKETHHALTE